MLNRSMVEQIKCRWREFRREPSAFFWVIFMPILWMLALGFAFSKPHPESYGIGWQAPAQASAWTEGLSQALRQDPQLKWRDGDTEDLRTKMKRGEISLIVGSSPDNAVVYTLDQNNPEAVRAQKYVDDLVQRFGIHTSVIYRLQGRFGRNIGAIHRLGHIATLLNACYLPEFFYHFFR